MAAKTRFINTASSAGGNGTTNATGGGDANRAYVSFDEFNTQEASDISTATGSDTQFVLNCDGSGGADTTGEVQMTGWTTDATGFVTINGNRSGHVYRTVNDGNGYRLEFTVPTSYDEGITFGADYTIINDFQMKITAAIKASQAFALRGTAIDANRCIAWAVNTPTAGGDSCGGFFQTSCDGGSIIACLAIDWTEANATGYKGLGGTNTQNWYNCTAHACEEGFERDHGNTRGRNLIAQDGTTGYSATAGWVATTSHNCSDLADIPGANSQQGEVLFTNEGADDFELSASDAVARGKGVDLSGIFDFDLANNTMPANWPIGCMQEAAGGGGTAVPVFRHHYMIQQR